MEWSDTVASGYRHLFDQMLILPERQTIATTIAKHIAANHARYLAVSKATGVPAWWIGIVHSLEAELKFSCHLHNGDPLRARTVRVPAGRPSRGFPPFTWEESAIDALTMRGLDKLTDWRLPRALYELEAYNGWGYVGHHTNSPYIWSFSNQYDEGKYIADGEWSASAVSEQCGGAVLLKCMLELGVLKMGADEEIIDVLESIAPKIATAVGGPIVGAVVKGVISMAENQTVQTPTVQIVTAPPVHTGDVVVDPLKHLLLIAGTAVATLLSGLGFAAGASLITSIGPLVIGVICMLAAGTDLMKSNTNTRVLIEMLDKLATAVTTKDESQAK